MALQNFGSQVRDRFQWGWLVGVAMVMLFGLTIPNSAIPFLTR